MPLLIVRLLAMAVLLSPALAAAQYAENPVPLPAALSGGLGPRYASAPTTAVQIGRRLFVGGGFSEMLPASGSAVVFAANGAPVAGAFPLVNGPVRRVVPDNAGGWLLIGDFTQVGGEAAAGFARVGPDRRLDPRYRVTADGPITVVAIAHGRIYLGGHFTTINGAARGGLAALSASTGQLTGWADTFDSGNRAIGALSVSSIGVYLSGYAPDYPRGPRLWGLDAGSGRVLFTRSTSAAALAATSTRVYVAASGYQRPLWAIDPLTGADTDWATSLRFQSISGTYGEYSGLAGLLLDGGRLYISGYFRTTDGRTGVAAVDAATGDGASWRPATQITDGSAALSRVGPFIVGARAGFLGPLLIDASTAAVQPFTPSIAGDVTGVTGAPEGALLVGNFVAGGAGAQRAGLASIDLDTYRLESWTSSLALSPAFGRVDRLATDGTWLFAAVNDGRLVKIDPGSGAVLAERQFPAYSFGRLVVASGEIVLALAGSPAEIGAVKISDWSYRVIARPSSQNYAAVSDLDIDGDTVYLTGYFSSVDGQPRTGMAAVHRLTGAVLPWRPEPDQPAATLRVAGGRVWVAGDFTRIGGRRRRGLAAVDPNTGAATAWNPDAPGTWQEGLGFERPRYLEIGSDGHLYVQLSDSSFPIFTARRPTVSGQATTSIVAFSTTTGARLPWRPKASGFVAVLPGCLFGSHGCLPRTIASPTNLTVSQRGASLTFTWALPQAAPVVTVPRLEVGTAEGLANLVSFDLAAGQTSFSAVVPPGSYFLRVRAVAGSAVSAPTPDVSWAVGPPAVPGAPLDVQGVTEGTMLTLSWRPPSTGAPAGYVLAVGSRPGRYDLASVGLPGTSTTFAVAAPAGRYWARLSAVNGAGSSAAGAELLLDVPGAVASCGTTPLPPTGLAASVTGRLVALTWQLPPGGLNVDALRIEVGSAPGLSDLATVAVAVTDEAFSIPAPAGTYYVRLVADNLCGTTAATSVVRVDVP